MHDPDIRELLRRWIASEGKDHGGVLIEELGLARGGVRVDMAIASEHLIGFEIKSEFDSLRRLADQVAVCSMVMTEMWLVSAKKHIAKARKSIPKWWGIIEVGNGCLKSVRCAKKNPRPDPYALAEVLWRDEALELLRSHGLDTGMKSKPHAQMCARLALELSDVELTRMATHAVKRRAHLRGRAAA